MDRILSTFIWFIYVIILICFYPLAVLIWLVSLPFDSRRKLLHWFTSLWASITFWINPYWKLKMEGLENIDRKSVYIFTPNHQSSIDIVTLYRSFLHFKWVSKAELFNIPILGWNMRMNRYIAIKRGNRASVQQMMDDSVMTLKNGSSIMIFPEGTRTDDPPDLRKFREGAYRLAKQTSTAIVPVLIAGAGKALPPYGFVFRGKHYIKIKFLPPVPVGEIESMEPAEMMGKMRVLMQEGVKELCREKLDLDKNRGKGKKL